MSENCSQNCNSCGEECTDRTEEQSDFSEKPHELSSIRKVIGIVSGKGGVGKSLVTSMLAVAMNRRGFKTAIMDADITGPSIPKVFGIREKVTGNDLGLFPAKTKTGIPVMSINLLLEKETDPVVWRGPILAGTVKQFWTDVIWGDVDVMFIDMPPGTGDVPLTVFQSIPLDGIIIVTSPQELVSMIVSKAVKMAEIMKVPVIGLVENMSCFICPDCGREYRLFGDSHIDEIARIHKLNVLGRLPVDPKLAGACDKGMIELYDGSWLDHAADMLASDFRDTLPASDGQGEDTLSAADSRATVNEKMGNGGKSMIKIAVASENGNVTEHFGHCEGFLIFEAEGDKILAGRFISNPGHRPGFLPNFLNDIGVNVIISGGMGSGAIEIFNEKGIEVITGAAGKAEDAVSRYLSGNLASTGSVCHEHQHREECGETCNH